MYLIESKIEEKGLLEATKNRELLSFLVLERERERLVILDLNLLESVILINLIKLLGCFLGWRLVSLL